MKAKKPSHKPKIYSIEEHVNMHSPHSESQSTTKELMPDSINNSPSSPHCGLRVMNHGLVLHTHQHCPMLCDEFEEQMHKEAMTVFNAIT